MLRKTIFASLLASSAMVLALATPAAANKTSDRAREAIAAAEAKIHSAETVGGSTAAPHNTAEARAALAVAKEDFASGHKDAAIQDAIRASALADTAIGISQQHKDDAVASAQDAQKASVDAARDQVSSAQQQAVAAQQRAADASARADTAQQSAAASAADAAAARNAAAIAVAQTPPATQVETTVTTQQPAIIHHATRTRAMRHSTRTKVTRRTTSSMVPDPSTQVTTTTKVTPQ